MRYYQVYHYIGVGLDEASKKEKTLVQRNIQAILNSPKIKTCVAGVRYSMCCYQCTYLLRVNYLNLSWQ